LEMSSGVLILFVLAASSLGGRLTSEDRCETVGAILGFDVSAPGLATMPCVVENHYADGKVVLNAEIVESTGGRRRWRPLLERGQNCGGRVVRVSIAELRRAASRGDSASAGGNNRDLGQPTRVPDAISRGSRPADGILRPPEIKGELIQWRLGLGRLQEFALSS